MKSAFIVLLALIVPLSALSQSNRDQCRTCHEALGDTPSELFKHDIHAEKGIGCTGCHGGDASQEEID